MAGDEGVYISNVSAATNMEDQLTESLRETANDLEHMELFDTEQRAEIYTILEAMRSDTELHRAVAARLAGEVGHA